MKIGERLMTALLFGCALAPCACVRHASSVVVADTATHSESQEVKDARADTVTEREVRSGPGRETVTVEEFAPDLGPTVIQAQDAHSGRTGAIQAPGSGVRGPPASRLVKRTVTVRETGPVVADTSTHAERETKTATETKIDTAAKATSTATTDSKPSVGCAFTGGLYVALVLAALAGIAYFAVKRALP